MKYLYADADVSPCGTYRYRLRRAWAKADPPRSVTWIMLNPSRADGDWDDPTVRRVVRFSCDFGYPALTIVNLFAFRCSDPFVLRRRPDVVGPYNDDAIKEAVAGADLVMAAWGTHGYWQRRDKWVMEMLARMGVTLNCLEITAGGFPKHPLYCKMELRPITYRGFAGHEQRVEEDRGRG